MVEVDDVAGMIEVDSIWLWVEKLKYDEGETVVDEV